MTTRRSFAVVGLVVLVALAGCTGGAGGDAASKRGATEAALAGSGDGGGGDADFQARATGTPAATPERAEAEERGQVQVQERARIRTGRVELEVDDFGAARRNLTVAAERRGGFVSDSRQRLHRLDNETFTTGVVVLRVPRGNFTDLMSRIEEEGTVLSTEQNTRDVTDQLVDIEARLNNLRAQRDQLRELYRRANDTREILEVQDRLTEVQTEIERLEARQQSLRRQVALSTITVELREPRPEPEPPDREQWYDTGIVAAFLESANGVVVTARAIAVALAFALPYLVVFGVPLVGMGYLVRRYRQSGDVEAVPEDTGGTDSEADAEDGGDGDAADDEADADEDGREDEDGGDGDATDDEGDADDDGREDEGDGNGSGSA